MTDVEGARTSAVAGAARDACTGRCAVPLTELCADAGTAEALPLDDGVVDHALAQLVLHVVPEPRRAASETARVVRRGGRVAACVWPLVPRARARCAVARVPG